MARVRRKTIEEWQRENDINLFSSSESETESDSDSDEVSEDECAQDMLDADMEDWSDNSETARNSGHFYSYDDDDLALKPESDTSCGGCEDRGSQGDESDMDHEDQDDEDDGFGEY